MKKGLVDTEQILLSNKMSYSSVISSGESERRWLVAMEKNFLPHHIVDVDFNAPFCVMRVPKTLSEDKPEAYAPQRIGLGPLHHLRPELYQMHNHKLAAVTRLLTPKKLQNFHLAVEALLPLEPLVRACYGQYLDLDMATLAWIFAIDGLYLLQFLKNYPEMKHLAGDVLMLENQIPLVLLHKIQRIFKLDLSIEHGFQALLEDQSPLELNTNAPAASNDSHLLHRMFHLIVSKRIVVLHITPATMFAMPFAESFGLNEISQSVQCIADLGLPGAGTAGKILTFVNKIPKDKILGLFKKKERTPTPSADEIDIPSVSQMTKIAKIRFILTPGGIRDIKFNDEEKELYLPSIRVKATTEILLRNLVAYEAATAEAGATLEMAEYVDLMCGLIDTAEDVKILREKEIVESELGDEEIAKMFNGIRKSEKKGDDTTKLEEAIESVNREYNSSMRVKVEKYGYSCFKFTSVVVTIAVLLLLTLQAFCSVFGCARWFANSNMNMKPSLLVSIK